MLLTARFGDGGLCKIRIARNGASIVTSEDEDGNCTYFRGASCEFGIPMKRYRAARRG
jgi:hypothetical protein